VSAILRLSPDGAESRVLSAIRAAIGMSMRHGGATIRSGMRYSWATRADASPPAVIAQVAVIRCAYADVGRIAIVARIRRPEVAILRVAFVVAVAGTVEYAAGVIIVVVCAAAFEASALILAAFVAAAPGAVTALIAVAVVVMVVV
jgi:hypothetical protein